MASKKNYWKSFEELTDNTLNEKLTTNEFTEEIPVDDFLGNDSAMENNQTSRRDFLKILGFSTAAVTLAACEAPIVKSVPYVVKPEDINPGVPTYYASTIFDGYDYANVLVRTREGRPIRIDANKGAKYFGSTNARVQASVLSLYDSDKIKTPLVNDGDKFKQTSWKEADNKVVKALASLGGKKAVILTSSIPSPSTKKLIAEFQAKYPTAQHVIYDAVSYSNGLDAAQEFYGKRELPFYDLSATELVVGFNADFLADYNGGGMEGAYAAARKPGVTMLRHIQVESVLSLTGANADTRIPLKPTDTEKLLAEVYNGLQGGSVSANAKAIVAELQAKGSKAVVMADGSKEAYSLAFAINQILGSVAVSNKAVLLKESNDTAFNQFIAEAKAGQVGVLFTYQVNPIYNSNKSKEIQAAFKNISLKVSLNEKLDETASLANLVLPVTHALESWNDFNPLTGVYSLQQPTIRRVFDSRQFQDSLIAWMTGQTEVVEVEDANDPILMMAKSATRQKVSPYFLYVKNNWEAAILPQLGVDFNKALYNGYNESQEATSFAGNAGVAATAAAKLAAGKASEWEIQFYAKTGLGDGTQANNPWLQELPDPITRNSWDNYLTVNPMDAEKLGIKIQDNYNVTNGRMQFDGEFVNVTVNGATVEVPVFIQPGQALGTVGLAFGYGRTKAGKVANNVGVNAFELYSGNVGASNVKIEKSSNTEKHPFANMQQQPTLMGRYEIAREVSLGDFINGDRNEWNPTSKLPTWRGDTPSNEVDLWASFDRSTGPHFNLSIDMNACTGCGACVIACQAENNVAVVGKDEMRRSRDMYWLRIDRYYSDVTYQDEAGKLTQKVALESDPDNEPQQYTRLIKPEAENPDVIFQPMMCQHCNHAPCETVCPVAATSHGRQGQNMMAYNRCVGTRYCANNCPYKVRRFNWFNYNLNDKFDFHMNNDLGRMVLNPDVVVRTRGVMEKCSFCIQQTQATILKAKKEGRKVSDSEFMEAAACAGACSSGAMKFGDINDDNSEVRKLSKDNRSYVLLEEIGTKPNVIYQVKVRNRKENA
ncbi:TAT-variant-translocated molybdopterin oxidoreductase [Faecalibacter rhinopitheci]|uniref:TAT-variant-translocated molybdopterin oxidoreductase n=1 Tax=Faecalibacter rhinopitheci TaxID=2779678 RepID=A0A8J7FNW8_9FLAO|nr:TAT-variant-translocated molybdopterin oxidoreductase [Faecalibacter rhinopitheci]MBF0597952.1 TAT-variant-translocated molybdopterin oxidoreductase [Faecalibacter rhinopitheci]